MAQLAHQAPMLAAMALMATVLRSTSGPLVIVAGLWVVAIVRARAARTGIAAREFLVDVLAMALVLIVPLIHSAPSSPSGMAMTGMTPGGEGCALPLILGWAAARLLLAYRTGNHGTRAASLVSGTCCAAGLLAMLLI